jgi:hypothetical protein
MIQQLIEWCKTWFTLGDYVAIGFFVVAMVVLWITYFINW